MALASNPIISLFAVSLRAGKNQKNPACSYTPPSHVFFRTGLELFCGFYKIRQAGAPQSLVLCFYVVHAAAHECVVYSMMCRSPAPALGFCKNHNSSNLKMFRGKACEGWAGLEWRKRGKDADATGLRSREQTPHRVTSAETVVERRRIRSIRAEDVHIGVIDHRR